MVGEVGTHEEGDESNLLFVKFPELVDPADRVIGLGFAVREVNHSRMSQAFVTRFPGQFWYRS